MSDVTVKGEAQWVSINIKNGSRTAIRLTNVKLDYGKFYREGDKNKEIAVGDINNKDIPPDDSLILYSCGRAHSPSGTEGSFTLLDVDDQKAIRRVYWDCPWGKPGNTFTVSGNNKSWVVESSGGNTESGAIGTVTMELFKKF